MKNKIYTLLLMMTTSTLFAQKWDGSSSTAWNLAANWDNNAVPTSGSSVTIDVTAPNQPKLAGNVTVKELKIKTGTLDLNGFTLTLTDKAEFEGGTVKNGFVAVAMDIKKMESTTFTGPLTITQNGASGKNDLKGGNTFNGVVTIVNNSTKDVEMAVNTPDIFNGDITFVQQNATGFLYPASKGTNNFKGNISTAGSVKPVTFGFGGGTMAINGTTVQNFNGPVAQAPVIKNLVMNTSKGLILNVPVTISGSLTLTSGIIYSTPSSLVIISDNATATGATNSSHVSGPVRKVGNEAFTFPTGKGSLYAPIIMTAPSNATDHFTAEYFNVPAPHTLTLLDILLLNHISKEEYWSFNRTNGTSTPTVTLTFNSLERSGGITNLNDLRVARWNSLLNLSSSHGNGGTTGNNAAGSVKTSSGVGSFGDFTIGSSSAGNPLSMIVAPADMAYGNPAVINSTSWLFKDVRNGVDAIITVTGAKNAVVDEIDNATTYYNSWQPFIKYLNTTTNNSDSSYVEFKVSFVKNGLPEVQKSIAMTVVDEDGEGKTGGFRELLKVSQPAVSKGIMNSLITVANDANWMTLIGTSQLFQNIDTTAYTAMSQVNIKNVSSFTMRVGVLGKITAGTVRQASFAFNNFTAMNVVLPVKVLSLDAQYVGNDAKVSFATSEEENMDRFEVYASADGSEYIKVAQVKANGHSQLTSTYTALDVLVARTAQNVFYKLKMIDNNGNFTWSSVTALKKSEIVPASVAGTVYPNPTRGILNLSFDNADTEMSIEVVDMFGKVLKSYDNSSLNYNSTLAIDATDFTTGVYFIRVTAQDGTASLTRFIKN
jgi:hypothetical protein